MWWSVVEYDGVCWSDEMKCDGWSPQLQKVTSTPKSQKSQKSHIDPQKVKKVKKNPTQQKNKMEYIN